MLSGSVRGVSRMGWVLRLVMVGGDRSTTSKGFDRSVAVVGVVTVLSPFVLRSEGMESWLPSRWRPILPSFSTIMKLVRTLERGLERGGLGDSVLEAKEGC